MAQAALGNVSAKSFYILHLLRFVYANACVAMTFCSFFIFLGQGRPCVI